MLRANGDRAMEACCYDALAERVFQIENVVLLLLRREGWRLDVWFEKRLCGLTPGSLRRNRYQLLLRVA